MRRMMAWFKDYREILDQVDLMAENNHKAGWAGL